MYAAADDDHGSDDNRVADDDRYHHNADDRDYDHDRADDDDVNAHDAAVDELLVAHRLRDCAGWCNAVRLDRRLDRHRVELRVSVEPLRQCRRVVQCTRRRNRPEPQRRHSRRRTHTPRDGHCVEFDWLCCCSVLAQLRRGRRSQRADDRFRARDLRYRFGRLDVDGGNG